MGIKADFVIAAEPTNLNIVNKAKGVLWLKISSKGKTAHGAYPWRGINAIWEMNRFLNLLQKSYPVAKKDGWVTTINLSKIETLNNSFNKIPDDCTVFLDIRYIPGKVDEVIRNIKKMLHGHFEMEIVVKEPSLSINQKDKYLKVLQKTVREIVSNKGQFHGANGTSDARHFASVGCSAVEFGPIGGGIGTDNEWVDIKCLQDYQDILRNFLLNFNHTPA
jgi:succinyl-diaminopimelate desuccinylase